MSIMLRRMNVVYVLVRCRNLFIICNSNTKTNKQTNRERSAVKLLHDIFGGVVYSSVRGGGDDKEERTKCVCNVYCAAIVHQYYATAWRDINW